MCARKMRRDGTKERQWRIRIDRQRRGGGTIAAFCREIGVSQASFYFWRREILRRDAERGNGRRNITPDYQTKDRIPPTLAPVQLIDAADDASRDETLSPDTNKNGSDSAIEILLTDGLTVRASSQVSADRIADVVRAIEARSC